MVREEGMNDRLLLQCNDRFRGAIRSLQSSIADYGVTDLSTSKMRTAVWALHALDSDHDKEK
jgi:hypothetical protein